MDTNNEKRKSPVEELEEERRLRVSEFSLIHLSTPVSAGDPAGTGLLVCG